MPTSIQKLHELGQSIWCDNISRGMIDSGRLGRIYHYRANFLQDWTIAEDVPQGGNALWRLDAAAAGSGVTGDLERPSPMRPSKHGRRTHSRPSRSGGSSVAASC